MRTIGVATLTLALGSGCPGPATEDTATSGTTAVTTGVTTTSSGVDESDSTWSLPDHDVPPPMPSQTAGCARYVECAATLMLRDAAAIESMYGPDAACWQESFEDASTCDSACAEAMSTLLAELEANGDPIPEVCDPPVELSWPDIETIIDAQCVQECHEPGGDDSSLDLSRDPYLSLYQVASEQSELYLVDPGSHEESYLWHKLAGSHGAAGGMGGRMPKGEPPLPPMTVEGIAAWIDAGASSF
ncbi:MAG: hypothetical protein K0V04_30160 [Deltaproteobacteria bacterium]|nr:hypothetical protein [Deltaproteobacteria bacterium]